MMLNFDRDAVELEEIKTDSQKVAFQKSNSIDIAAIVRDEIVAELKDEGKTYEEIEEIVLSFGL